MNNTNNPESTKLPLIPAKRYFSIGEVSELCSVKPHILRYWEQEFTQLSPLKRRGNRRYYQHHEVLLIRKIRALLYEEGFTIKGARDRLENRHVATKIQPELKNLNSINPAVLRNALQDILQSLRSVSCFSAPE